MIKKILVVFILTLCFSLFAELENINPDPDGEPWWVGSLRPLSEEDWEMLSSVQKLTLPISHRDRPLPSQVNNSELPYFRPIFSQEGGSCGQASGVGYNFTYEIDFERDLPADNPLNQYPTHYTWNFLNGGGGNGSWYWDGWEIIKKNGCPNVAEYGGMAYGGDKRWLNGYANYYSGMHNRTLEFYAIDVSDEEGLTVLKNWMNDHLNDSEYGGLTNFAAGVTGYTMDFLPADTPEEGKSVVLHWNVPVNHALTFVGYNDSIRWDYNGDGYYTNDIDINDDGEINMQDWEIGGLIVANSWGNGWGDEGKAYMMYKLLADPTEEGGIWSNTVHVLKTREIYHPLLTLKTIIEHDSRDKLKIYAGVSADPAARNPDLLHIFPLFNFQGGPYYMQGGEEEYHKQIEIGLDITPLISGINHTDLSNFFLIVENSDPENVGTGQIISYSIIDYTEGEEEVVCEEMNVPIINNETTMLKIQKTVNYNSVYITTETLPAIDPGEEYSFQLEAADGTPPYSWGLNLNYQIDYDFEAFQPGEGEQLVPTNNDDGFSLIDLEFDFPFFGEFFDHVTISTDGSITFGNSFAYIRNNEGLMANRAITPYGSDLEIYPEQNDGIWFDSYDDQAILYWKTSKYADPQADIEFAVKIDADGMIEFYHLHDNTASNNWVSGISWGDNVNYFFSNISGSPDFPPDYHTTFTKPDFPYGMMITEDGLFTGTIYESDETWSVTFKVTDHNYIYSSKTFEFSSTSSSSLDNLVSPVIRLYQNFPNPFNPSGAGRSPETTIYFSAEGSAKAELTIYNLKGQKIKSYMFSDHDLLDINEVVWNGKDSAYNDVPSGIYIYKLTTENSDFSRKMVLLK